MTMKIYTRVGDRGRTSLADGSDVDKYDIRVEAYGSIDEANSWIGAARSRCKDAKMDHVLAFLNQRFFNCASLVATPLRHVPAKVEITVADVTVLETAIDRMSEALPPLSHFILPGGTRLSGMLHIARTVTRRAERRVCELAAHEDVESHVIKFLNRASDLLFVCARYANHLEQQPDVLWDRNAVPPAP